MLSSRSGIRAKRSASNRMHSAFTLIEVMVAVVIISVVIMALLEMNGNNRYIFSKLTKESSINQYSSFFISNEAYGFEKKNIYMDDLVSDFKVHDDLRRELKKVKIEILYQEVQKFNMGSGLLADANNTANTQTQDPYDEETVAEADMFFEIGKTILKLDNENPKEVITTSLLRLRIK